MLPRRPRFVVGATDLTLSLPVKAWEPELASVGSSRTSAAGIIAAYQVRRDDLLGLMLRFFESEWPDLRDAIDLMQFGEAFTWYPDADDTGTSFSVYLETPKMGDKVKPSRNGDYPRAFELALTLRGVTSAPWLAYFDG